MHFLEQIDFCYSIVGLSYKGHKRYKSWFGGIVSISLFFSFIGIICCIACGYESQLKDAETKAQAEEIANKIKICYKDMIIKELEEEIKKLNKRKKSK